MTLGTQLMEVTYEEKKSQIIPVCCWAQRLVFDVLQQPAAPAMPSKPEQQKVFLLSSVDKNKYKDVCTILLHLLRSGRLDRPEAWRQVSHRCTIPLRLHTCYCGRRAVAQREVPRGVCQWPMGAEPQVP